ncbi:TPA: response regulator, partial [Streptococcus agalactiae]|nr:response regulator [Streptococcus agalactiae]
MNILIVEDDDNKAQDIITFLIKEGVMSLSIKTVDNVNDALTLLRETKYDILLLDLSLPLRKSGHPIPDGGSKILYNLTSPYFLTPSHVIGLTQFSDLSDNERPKFQKFDFNIYDYNIDIWKDVLSQKLKWILKHTT